MNRRPFGLSVILLGLILSGPSAVAAQAPSGSQGEADVRVLMVGDSWSEFMWVARSLRDVFADNGRPDIVEDGTTTAISGSTAAEWARPENLALITEALDNLPLVDVVQLTIGGNDFLAGQSGGGWFVGMPAQDFTALQDQVLADAAVVVDHIQAQRPGIQILLSHYDYTNFEDSLLPNCPGTWSDLGQPTPLQINTAATELQDRVDAFAASREGVHSVRHLGWMQFHFGFPGDGINPGDLIPPGDLSRPSPIESMFLGTDCFHLSGESYDLLGQNLWDGFYDAYFNGGIFADGFESGDLSSWNP